MTKRIKLGVLFGGCSSEYEVSLSSAYSVLSHLDAEKYDVIRIGITREGVWTLFEGDIEAIRDGSWCSCEEALPRVTVDLTPGSHSFLVRERGEERIRRVAVDVVFPVLHGAFGEDGRIQGMLSSAGIPFVGCDSTSSGVCMDKALTKAVVNGIGVEQAECMVLYRGRSEQRQRAVQEAEEKLGYPIFVKPARAGSSVGVSKAKDRAQLLQSMEIAFREDEKILLEKAIVGREIETAVLEEDGQCTVSDCAEIVAGVEFYDYEAKYISNTSSFYIPAHLPECVRDEVRRSALAIFQALDCRTLARVDFFVREDNSVVFNEINTLPGFTDISMYPKLMMHSGMTYSELLDRLIRSSLRKG